VHILPALSVKLHVTSVEAEVDVVVVVAVVVWLIVVAAAKNVIIETRSKTFV